MMSPCIQASCEVLLLLCPEGNTKTIWSMLELAVVKGSSFPLEGVGLGVSYKLIHCSSCVEIRFYSAFLHSVFSVRRRKQFYLELSLLLLFYLFIIIFFLGKKLFRKSSLVLKERMNKCRFLLIEWNTEFLEGRIKEFGGVEVSPFLLEKETKINTALFY